MNAQTGSKRKTVPNAQGLKNKHAVVSVGLTVVVILVAIFLVRPRVGSFLEVKRAYWNLSSADEDARSNSIRRLRNLGEETISPLIAILHHSDKDVRNFAAAELAHRTQVTDDTIEAFLNALESKRHVAEIGRHAPKLFFRYAEANTGPLTETDQRMIAWLKPELKSTNPDSCGTAAWALTAFASRDASLSEPLAAYLKSAPFFYKYVLLREMADRDPLMRDEYVDVLLSGLGSLALNDQSNALYGLANLKNKPDNLKSRLETMRKESTNPGEVSRIDRALEQMTRNDVRQP